MKDVFNATLIQILTTNHCPFDCANCSQMIPHQAKKFHAALETIEKALWTLTNWNGHVGLFGGEPTCHPQFGEICKLMQKYVPVKARRELWTAGTNWCKYKDVIEETFYKELIAYNDHSKPDECWHQPVQIAIEEVFGARDKDKMKKIIDNCWVQLRWSPSITPMGAYFCEIAAARAMILGYPKGLDVEWDWWKAPLSAYQYQIEALCKKCSACLPMPMKANSYQNYDDVSQGILAELYEHNSPKANEGHCKCVDIEALQNYYTDHEFIPIDPKKNYQLRGGFEDFPDWTPWLYRNFHKNEPNGSERPVSEIREEQKGKRPRGRPRKMQTGVEYKAE